MKTYRLSGLKPRTLTIDVSDRIWLGDGQLARFDPESERLLIYSLSVSDLNIANLTVDISGTVWVVDPEKNRIGKIEGSGP